MRIIVVYRSFLGTTRRYAQWLKEALHADIIDFKHVNERTFVDYDVVIVTSGTYAGKMPLVTFLKNYWTNLAIKKVVVIAVGIAPVEDKQSVSSYESIPQEIRNTVKYFKVPGNMFGLKPSGEPSKEMLAPVITYVQALEDKGLAK